jgi:hypothetical protein
VTGTVSKGKGVCCEAESEGSRKQNPDPTNRNRIEGRLSGVIQQWMEKPASHSDTMAVNPAGARRKATELTLGDLSHCPDEADYWDGNSLGWSERSQQRP